MKFKVCSKSFDVSRIIDHRAIKRMKNNLSKRHKFNAGVSTACFNSSINECGFAIETFIIKHSIHHSLHESRKSVARSERQSRRIKKILKTIEVTDDET